MGEHRVGDAGRAGAGVVVAVGDRLVGDVPAGQHDRRGRPPRRAGGAAACRAAARRRRGCPAPRTARAGRRGRRRQQHDRRGAGTVSSLLRDRSTSASVPAAARSAAITANGLSSRCLRARSAADGRLVGGVGGQVVAAEALDRERPRRRRSSSAARRSGPGRRAQRLATGRPSHERAAAGRRPGSTPAGRGSAGRAGSAYSRGAVARTSGTAAIVVSGTVVRDAGDDREPGPAVRCS